jgi:hypothetical protein
MLTLNDPMPVDFTGRVASNNSFDGVDDNGVTRVYCQVWDFQNGRLVGSGVMRWSATRYTS